MLDPHGDLMDEVLERIPENLHEDVILFDPSDKDHPADVEIKRPAPKQETAPQKKSKEGADPWQKRKEREEIDQEQAKVLDCSSPASQEKVRQVTREVKAGQSLSGRGGT